MQHGLCSLERTAVIGVIAHDNFVEQRTACGPKCQQHGQQNQHDDDIQGYTALALTLAAQA
ncbi:hypothetical protein BA022_01050 [Diaphorobacter nitroreducens]|nr:hypothetical protein BA022_01050 [Diaphorobacter nitroreducens]